MLPEEVYANSASSNTFKYSHPLNHSPINDGSMRARIAYDLMAFMRHSDCPYFLSSDALEGYNPTNSDDEVDIMIVDGFYKEAERLVDQRLADTPEDDKALFQKAFIQHLKREYEGLLAREEKALKQDPNNVNALINKGFVLANLNREDEALDTVNKALSLDPDNLAGLSNKAYLAKLLGRDEVREHTLALAYNVVAQKRVEALQAQEAALLADLDSQFMQSDIPSAFDDFNRLSGANQSNMVH